MYDYRTPGEWWGKVLWGKQIWYIQALICSLGFGQELSLSSFGNIYVHNKALPKGFLELHTSWERDTEQQSYRISRCFCFLNAAWTGREVFRLPARFSFFLKSIISFSYWGLWRQKVLQPSSGLSLMTLRPQLIQVLCIIMYNCCWSQDAFNLCRAHQSCYAGAFTVCYYNTIFMYRPLLCSFSGPSPCISI